LSVVRCPGFVRHSDGWPTLGPLLDSSAKGFAVLRVASNVPVPTTAIDRYNGAVIMESTDLTVQILIDIRDEIKGTNAEVKQLKEETKQLKEETKKGFAEMGRRIDQTNRQLLTTETRLATEISALRAGYDDGAAERRELRDRVTRCERDIEELRQRLG
jgi:hypothetical protein